MPTTGTPTFCISATTDAACCQAQPETAEHLIALDPFLGGGDGAVRAQAVVVDGHRHLAAVDAAAVVERLDVEIEALPGGRVGAGERPRQIRDVADFIVLRLQIFDFVGAMFLLLLVIMMSSCR